MRDSETDIRARGLGTWFYGHDTWPRNIESSAAVLRFQSAL